MREQHGVLREGRDAPRVRRHPGAGGGGGEHTVAEDNPPVGGAQRTGDQGQDRGLPGAVGADEGEGLAGGDLELDLDPALGDHGLQREAHAGTLRRASAMMRIATIMSRKDSATAACGSLSRWR